MLSMLAILASACGARKKARGQNIESGNILQTDSLQIAVIQGRSAAELMQMPWTHLSGKADMKVNADGQGLGFTAFFRMRRDSLVWMSFSPGLGITAARVLISRDSVKVVNFIEKYYSVFGIEDLQKRINVQLGLPELQNMLVGLPVFDTARYFLDSSEIVWEARVNNLLNKLHFTASGRESTLNSSQISQPKLFREFSAQYKGRKNSSDNVKISMPATIHLKASAPGSQSEASMEILELNAGIITQYPFQIPASYERR